MPLICIFTHGYRSLATYGSSVSVYLCYCPGKGNTVELHGLYCHLCVYLNKTMSCRKIKKKKKDISKPDLLQNESLLFGNGRCQASGGMAKGPDYSSLFTCPLVLHPANEPHTALHAPQCSEAGCCGNGVIHSHGFTS